MTLLQLFTLFTLFTLITLLTLFTLLNVIEHFGTLMNTIEHYCTILVLWVSGVLEVLVILGGVRGFRSYRVFLHFRD